MVSRRNFLSIVAIMLVVLFMFQATNVALEMWNDFDDNAYAVDVEGLPGRDSAFVPGGSGEEGTPWQTERPCVVFIGGADSPVAQVVSNWAAYTKWDFAAAAGPSDYDLGEPVPDLIVLDGARINWNGETVRQVKAYAGSGINLVFAGLPGPDVIRKHQTLQDLLGIYRVNAAHTQVEGIHLYKGFLLGGEVIYRSQKEDDAWRADLELDMPWYILGDGTKIYMKGIPDEDKKVKVEDHPAVVWRRRMEGAYIFAVNGPYMEDATGLGLLSAMTTESSSYSVYPVVNAQNLVAANYPGLSIENSADMKRYYSHSMRGVYRDFLWPDITGIYHRSNMGLSCMMSMQFDYSDGALPDQGQFIYYMKAINELHGEAGLSGTSVSDTPAASQLAEDFSFLENAQLDYQFTSYYTGGQEEEQIMDALGWSDLSTVRTVVSPYDGGSEVIGYQTDGVTKQMTVTDGFSHTYASDLRMRSLQTALAYTSVLIDAVRPLYPETVDDTWGLLARQLTSDVPHFWKGFKFFDATTVSECDEHIRDFLSLDYAHAPDGDGIVIRHNSSAVVWFILRVAGRTVEHIEGGTCQILEQGVYLIEAHEQEVRVSLRVRYTEPEKKD